LEGRLRGDPERLVNQGGEPGHDDYGLPRVDIEIPDDARELDRDVQAYHRELRALRRSQRSRRWRAPLQRPGALLPLVAGCLLVAMLSGMVLTMFSANTYISGFSDRRSPTASPARHPAQSAPATRPPGAMLPDKPITVGGRRVALRTLRRVALAIIPAACGCDYALRELLAAAKQAKVPVYLIAPPGSRAAVARLAASSRSPGARLATDTGNFLAAAYHPAGLTLLLVNYRREVTVATKWLSAPQLTRRLASLGHGAIADKRTPGTPSGT
jgi:hypothetical protein